MADNFLLYLKCGNDLPDYTKFKNIYCFNNKKIIAINELEYNQSARLDLETTLKIRPYFLSQQVFKETLFYVLKNINNIILKNIEFLDDSLEETQEYEELQDFLKYNYKEQSYKQIYTILEEYDTEIYNIKIRYKNYDFVLTSMGVLEVNAPKFILNSFINDSHFNNLILGFN